MTAASTSYRYIVYSITFASSGAHTLKSSYSGPTTKRVDVVAFIVLR